MSNKFTESLIKIKDRAILDLQRGQKKLETTVTQKLQTRLRDESIRVAWMEMQSDPPWSVEKFLNELSGYEDNRIFEQIELSKYNFLQILTYACTFMTDFLLD